MAADPATIEAMLREALAPSHLAVRDDSALHAGHAGAASGGGHYDVTIVSERFTGHSRVARHRMVYDALRGLFPAQIHALAVTAFTDQEYQSRASSRDSSSNSQT
ncbi:DNA-binding transcriptional regulator BolA [compost metagenome]|jgi:BolA protein|uniref:BolA family transcriptional regulator n=1 Tax=Cupriavidus necator (strain ATCC 17699 / DSM 428 / KCTC 22496 / NCIMB 10442 / H16 / Stanier 337) TaxID=381666 RepID=Q0KBH4_CUPNH|nr:MULTISPECIES: BolA family transcriptional regulator [Cupriavidus]EON20468.1 stress-induced morphogen (activity unknown) [Cupriavidus sp. GA3-3]EYS92848.1 BolA family transcriptional regulator [Cupriavidus sp. SK-4]KUE88730.1 BolA family transcriptional regulator [Cupriavidus necator]QCC00525.1 BolA family transcriptional regulator [Cupriavidus necator H16]QQB76656.1 BolA family transcriptional regulator [Cupriavidus necator]